MSIVRLTTFPIMSANRFTLDKAIRMHGLVPPCYLNSTSGHIEVQGKYVLEGYCPFMKDVHGLRFAGRDGQTGIMLFHPEHGEVWEHWPFLDQDDIDEATVDTTPLRRLL